MKPLREVKIDGSVLSKVEEALRSAGVIPLGTYGFLDITVQPYDGMYSNPYPKGEAKEVRLIKSNYHEQNAADRRAMASCEAAYLEAPE